MTLERSLCISQDGEFPVGPDISSTPEPATSTSTKSQVEEIQREEEKEAEKVTDIDLCNSQCEEEEESVWEESGCQQNVPSEGEEDVEADLACSMQYDEEEIEQLNMMVHRVGDQMSTLLSPPSQRQSPTHNSRPYRPNLAGSRGPSSTENSPQRAPGSFQEEDERVFFMDDLEGLGSVGFVVTSAEVCQGQRASPNIRGRPTPSTDSTCNGWVAVCQSDESVSQSNQHKPCPSSETVGTTDTLPLVNGWEGPHDEEGAETAEVIAHRTGGMKLSATVIFNPRSPSLSDLAVVLPHSGEGSIAAHGNALVATHCLLNSCVCCATSCLDSHDDPVATETAGGGGALGFDKLKLTITNSVIQSAVGTGSIGKGDGPLPLPPPPTPQPVREEDGEPEGGDFSQSLYCEKCLDSSSSSTLSQDRDSGDSGELRDSCTHQSRACKVMKSTAAKERQEKQSKEDKMNYRFVLLFVSVCVFAKREFFYLLLFLIFILLRGAQDISR